MVTISKLFSFTWLVEIDWSTDQKKVKGVLLQSSSFEDDDLSIQAL
jgi:hypothetical protein